MKIPKYCNIVWDWAEDNARTLAIVAILVISGVATIWMPALGAFVFGVATGGTAVYLRLAARLKKVRAEEDDLLRENGALRHQKTVLANHATASDTLVTQVIPAIPVTTRPPPATAATEPPVDLQERDGTAAVPDDLASADRLAPADDQGLADDSTAADGSALPEDPAPAENPAHPGTTTHDTQDLPRASAHDAQELREFMPLSGNLADETQELPEVPAIPDDRHAA